MELISKIQELGIKSESLEANLQTEEATKTALVLPFLNLLGYNVFDPTEVVPEFTADQGIKKGEKVDYALLIEDKPVILIECKKVGCTLDAAKESQLFRYFATGAARIGILTDGVVYKFYSDLEEENKMDSTPFLELNIRNLDPKSISASEISRFSKTDFDLEHIKERGRELKFQNGMVRAMFEEWQNPSENFVKHFTSKVYKGRFTQNVKDQFTDITKKAFQAFIRSKINETFQQAMEAESAKPEQSTEGQDPVLEENQDSSDKPRIVTTEEEWQAFYLVRSLLAEHIEMEKLYIRDTASYCSILFDDNNRKPVCRLRFNGSSKQIGIFDEKKNETRFPVDSLNDITKYKAELIKSLSSYIDDKDLDRNVS